MNDLFRNLCRKLNVSPDRRGECHIPCPSCGKEPGKRGNVHFSFSERGGYCFTCSYSCGLFQLGKDLGLLDDNPLKMVPVKPMPKPTITHNWFEHAEDLVRSFELHPERLAKWEAYKRLPRAVIARRRLGVGSLPESRCQHERLIVPVIDAGRIVGLRGRQLACDCGKWLASGGTTLEMLPLYNAAWIRPGSLIFIVENPVDALLLSSFTPYAGVATYSVAYWRDTWTATLQALRPEMVMVAYDNDLPGNGGGSRRREMEQAWFSNHPKANRIPPSKGPELATHLAQAGLPVRLWNWDGLPYKDVGNWLGSAPRMA